MARKTTGPPHRGDKEKTRAQEELERFTLHCAKCKAKTGQAKALESFKPMRIDDPRWQKAMAVGDCWVFVEADSFVFGIYSESAGRNIPIFVDWAIVHTMHSATGKISEFRVNRHQGYWRFKTSASVMRKAAGNKVSLLSPEGHALPPKQDGTVTPHMGERDMLCRDFAAVLGVPQHVASEWFFKLTGK